MNLTKNQKASLRLALACVTRVDGGRTVEAIERGPELSPGHCVFVSTATTPGAIEVAHAPITSVAENATDDVVRELLRRSLDGDVILSVDDGRECISVWLSREARGS